MSSSSCNVRICTFNVNGMRGVLRRKGCVHVGELLAELDVDICCFQEMKLFEHDASQNECCADNWKSFASLCDPAISSMGYSGVATFSKIPTSNAWPGVSSYVIHAIPYIDNLADYFDIDNNNTINPNYPFNSKNLHPIALAPPPPNYSRVALKRIDQEGRMITTVHPGFVLINIYAPAIAEDPTRLHLKHAFQAAVFAAVYIIRQSGFKPVIVGDFNVSPRIQDSASLSESVNNLNDDIGSTTAAGMVSYAHKNPTTLALEKAHSKELRVFGGAMSPHRHWLGELISFNKLNDTFILKYPDQINVYTCWNQASGARLTNYGSRIDLVLVPDTGIDVKECEILPDFSGSDHCPVIATIEPLEITYCEGQFRDLSCDMSTWTSTKKKQLKLTSYLQSTQRVTMTKATNKSSSLITSFGFLKRTRTVQQEVIDLESPEEPPEEPAPAPAPLEPPEPLEKLSPSSSSSSVEALPSSSVRLCPSEYLSFLSHQERDRYVLNSSIAPLCSGHHEACILRRVNKDGPTKGRAFWTCARPDATTNTAQGRCNFFCWADQVKSKRGSALALEKWLARKTKQ